MVPLTKLQLTKALAEANETVVAVRAENARLACETEELRWRLRKALVDLALAEKRPYGVL